MQKGPHWSNATTFGGAGDSKFANIATRRVVQTGNNALIGGFVP